MRKLQYLSLAIVFAISLSASGQESSNKVIKDGLVAHYLFDGDFKDNSGNEYDYTDVQAGFGSDRHGQTYKALKLDGSKSGAKRLTGYPKLFSGSLTVSMWVYFNDDTRAILLGSYNAANNVNFEKHTGNRLRIWWNNGQRDLYSSAGTITTKKWQLVTFVRDKEKDELTIYLDGQQVARTSGAGMDVEPTGPFYIGRDSRTGSTVMDGKIDEVQIYNRALSWEEIRSLYSPGQTVTDNTVPTNEFGLVAWYTFDGDFADNTGNKYHCTNQGAEFTYDRIGYENAALSLNGSNSGAKLANGCPDVFTGSMTVSMWVRFYDDTRAILLGSYNTANNVNFEKHTGNRLRIWWNNGQRDVYSPKGTITTNKWHFVTFVRNKAKDKFFIYLDGIQVLDMSGMGSDVRPAGPFYIGRDSRTGSTVMKGEIDDVKIYDRALSPQEIMANFKK